MGLTRVVVTGPAEHERLARLRAFAEDPANLVKVGDLLAGERRPPGDYPGHVAGIPGGVRVVLSLELQPNGGTYRHASFSVRPATRELPLPSEAVVREILPLLGFTEPLERCMVWIEGRAVNAVEGPLPPKAEGRACRGG